MASPPLCSLSYEHSKSRQEIIDDLKEAAKETRGYVNGDLNSGKFLIGKGFKRIGGSYLFIDDSVININITKKSWAATCEKIDNEFSQYFENNGNLSTLLDMSEEPAEAEAI